MAILSIGELLGMGPSELSGLIPYSGLEYSGTAITGISGSAIGGVGGVPESSVSAIASSYAESAASSKVDQSAFDDCCSAVNDALSGISGAVSGVTGQTGNYIDWSSSGVFQPSGDYAFNSALSGKLDNSASSTWYPMTGNPSGFLTEHQSLSGYATEAYVDSSVSSKQDVSGMSSYVTTGDLSAKLDTSAVNFDGDSSHVTGISGVPLSAQGGGDYVEKSALEVKIGSANIASAISFTQGSGNSASSNSFAQGYANSASSNSFAQGIFNGATGGNSFAQGGSNSASDRSFAQGHCNTASDRSFAQGEYNSASGISFAQGYYNTASGNSFAQGKYNTAINTAAAFGQYNLHGNGSTSTGNSAAFVIGDGTSQYARHDLMLVTKNGEITMYSSTADTVGFGIVSSIKGKLDVSSVNFNGDSSYVTGISGVPLNAQGGGGGGYVEKSAMEVTIGSANTASSTAIAQGVKNSAYFGSFAQGRNSTASENSFSQGYYNTASSESFAQGRTNTAIFDSFAQGLGNSASSISFAQGQYNSAQSNSFAHGYYNSAKNTAAVFGQYNLHGNGSTTTGDSAAFVIGDGTSKKYRHDLMLVTKNGEITMYSSTADTVGFGIVSSIKAISAAGSSKLNVSSVNFNGDSSYVTGISGIPFSAIPVEPPMIPLTSTDGSVIITNQGTYADVIVTGTTGDFEVSGVSILALFRWATSQGYQP